MMTSPLVYGFASALCYGLGDFISRTASRAVGLWRSLFYGNLFALTAVSVVLLVFHRTSSLSHTSAAASYAAAIAAGLFLFGAAALFNRALLSGHISVVVPITTSYGAITALLSIVSGERLSERVAIGLLITVISVCVVSIPPQAQYQFKEHFRASGIGWAVGASACYGVGFWLQGSFSVPELGSFIPVWVSYASGLGALALLSPVLPITLKVPEWRSLIVVVAAGTLSVVAYTALSLGLSTGNVSIVVVLSTLSSAVTMLLARFISKESIVMHQWIAVGGLIAGTSLIRW